MAWLLANRKEPYFTVTVQSASAPFNYSFTPYITCRRIVLGGLWGDGSEETFTTASTAEKKTHRTALRGPYTCACLVVPGHKPRENIPDGMQVRRP